MKQERVRSKHGFRGFGTFILGWFVGFLCTILIIAGVGYWAYTSLSVGKVEKWTKTDIAGDNDGVRKLTLQDVVSIASGVAKGSDNYTLAKFEEDFGLKLLGDSMYGISLGKVKNAPIKELKTALEDTIDSATFNNILSFMEVNEDELGLLNTVLDTKVEYYVNNSKLYTTIEHETEVNFDYIIDGNTVEFSNGSHTIASNKITPRLRDLPLNTAMSSMSDATEGLKIYEVLGYYYNSTKDKYYENYNSLTDTYSNELTGILGSLAGYSVGDLSNNETFNGLYIHEVMGYYENDGKYYQNYNSGTGEYSNEVTGVLKYLAPSTIENLSATINSLTLGQALDVKFENASGIWKVFYNKPINDLEDEIKNIKVYQAMGYYYDDVTEKYYNTLNGENYENEVELVGIVKAIANTPVSELSKTIKELKAKDVFDRSETVVLNLFVKDDGEGGEDTTELDNLTVMDLPSAVVAKINHEDTTLGVLLDAGVIEMTNLPAEDDPIRDKTIVELIEIAMEALQQNQ